MITAELILSRVLFTAVFTGGFVLFTAGIGRRRSAVLSVVCALVGMLVSILSGTPVGSTIVAVDALAFFLFTLIGRLKGGISHA